MAANLVTSLIIRLVDQVTAPVRRILGSLGDVERGARRAGGAFKLSADIKHAADNLRDFSRGVVGIVAEPVKKFADFEEQMSSVKAATFDLTKAMDPGQVKEMDAAVASLAARARQLGAETKFTATEVAAGMDILAKNFGGDDLKKAADIKAAMPGILNVAAATRESIESASDILTASMNQFGLQAEHMGGIGDIFVKTANSTATGLLDLGEALKYSGATAKNANVDLETTLAMLGALGNAGKKGSNAGTALASILGNVQSGMKKQRGALAALGINISDKSGNLRPILDLFEEINKAADKKFGVGQGGVKRDRWMQGLVGMGGDKEGLAILLKAAGSGQLRELTAANKAASGTAAKVAEEMGRNTAGAARTLQSAYEELQLTIGEQLIPNVIALIKWINALTTSVTAWAQEHPDLVRNLGLLLGILGGFGIVVAPVLRGVAAMTTLFGALGAGLRVVFAIARAHPFVAIATAAYLIIEYWEPIKDFFVALWDAVVEAFTVAYDYIVGKIETIKKTVEETIAAFTDPLAASNKITAYIEAKKAGADRADDPARAAAFQSWAAGLVGATPSGAAAVAENGNVKQAAFAGELKITVNGEGRVTRQELQTRGDAGFVVRSNTGGQR